MWGWEICCCSASCLGDLVYRGMSHGFSVLSLGLVNQRLCIQGYVYTLFLLILWLKYELLELLQLTNHPSLAWFEAFMWKLKYMEKTHMPDLVTTNHHTWRHQQSNLGRGKSIHHRVSFTSGMLRPCQLRQIPTTSTLEISTSNLRLFKMAFDLTALCQSQGLIKGGFGIADLLLHRHSPTADKCPYG